MTATARIQAECQKATTKKQDFTEKLRLLEAAEQKSFHDIWMTRDQMAYWQGMAEGLTFALEEIRRAEENNPAAR